MSNGTTINTDLFDPEVLQDAIIAGFVGVKALDGSEAVVVNDSLPGDKGNGSKVTVPYFGNMGEFEDISPDGDGPAPTKLTMDSEQASVIQSAKGWNLTDWAQMQAQFADPEGEGARQLIEMASRRGDKALIDASTSGLPSTMIKDVHSNTTPRKMDWDGLVDAKMLWGDEQEEIVLLAMHSKTYGDVQKIKSADGIPLFQPPEDGGPARFAGIPIRVSDRLAPDHSNVTSTGTTPPAVTFTGVPNGVYQIEIDVTTAGAVGAAVFKYSLDDGVTFATGVVTASAVLLGTSGVTAHFAAGTYATDNVYRSLAKFTTLLLKRRALVLWRNRKPQIESQRMVTNASTLAYVHIFFVAYRYRTLPGKVHGGVAALKHN
jgi:hypothetical protein